MYKFSKRSWKSLGGVHPKLVAVTSMALRISSVDFTVLEGVRTLERQRHLVNIGASDTLRSKHLIGRAVDLGAWEGGSISYHWPLYEVLAGAMLEAAYVYGVEVNWGGHWTTLKDGPHFELGEEE